MKIVIDAFGGDNAPLEIIKGAALAQKEYNVDIILSGDKEKINSVIKDNGISFNNLEIIDTPEVISMHDEPTDIVKSKKNCSMAKAFYALADGTADAFVSAGSTGAIVVGGTLIVKRIKGITRPAIGTVIPSPDKTYMLMDCGANAECRPEMLKQFAIMSSIYMEKVENRLNPKVGLLNIGTEDTKGTPLQKEAYVLLKNSGLNFYGNLEARDMPQGVCDVVVADGFTGNIALKLTEGAIKTLFGMLKGIFYKNIFTKLATLVLKDGLYSLKKKLNSSEVGGALLLGVRKPVIKAHGNSDAYAIKNAIHQAIICCEKDIIGTISAEISKTDKEDENA